MEANPVKNASSLFLFSGELETGLFSTVMQTLEFVSNLHKCINVSNSPTPPLPPLVFISGYANIQGLIACCHFCCFVILYKL